MRKRITRQSLVHVDVMVKVVSYTSEHLEDGKLYHCKLAGQVHNIWVLSLAVLPSCIARANGPLILVATKENRQMAFQGTVLLEDRNKETVASVHQKLRSDNRTGVHALVSACMRTPVMLP